MEADLNTRILALEWGLKYKMKLKKLVKRWSVADRALPYIIDNPVQSLVPHMIL